MPSRTSASVAYQCDVDEDVGEHPWLVLVAYPDLVDLAGQPVLRAASTHRTEAAARRAKAQIEGSAGMARG